MQEKQITQLLRRAEAGETEALDEVVAALYDDLRRRARSQLARRPRSESGGVTLQPTALVNETYMRLIRQNSGFANRNHFLAIATKLMFRVLADYRKSQSREKRGGAAIRVTLTGLAQQGGPSARATDVAAAVERLEQLDERKAAVVKLRAIWGFDTAETATTLGISTATVERDWRFAKSWLIEELGPST